MQELTIRSESVQRMYSFYRENKLIVALHLGISHTAFVLMNSFGLKMALSVANRFGNLKMKKLSQIFLRR